jgi:hypothetical protein
MTTKTDLHRLIDELPERALPVAERFLTALEADESVPRVPLDQAPLEPPAEDEVAALAEVRDERDAGAGRLSHEELRRELGL